MIHLHTIWDLYALITGLSALVILVADGLHLYEKYVYLPRKYPRLFGRE